MKLTRIKEVIEEKGLKQSKITEVTGAKPRTVVGWVANSSWPTLKKLFIVAAALGVHPRELLADTNPFADPQPQTNEQ